MPHAVSPGDDVYMRCRYNLDNDQLYTVKWYKGRQEFFRYVPKELPNTKVFPLPGVNVDVSLSDAHQVVLKAVRLNMSGKYRCEVSADQPNFHTEMVAGELHVVYLPGDDSPVLMAEKQRYSIGDTLRANCTVRGAHPAANVTWLLNDVKINSSSERTFPTPLGYGRPGSKAGKQQSPAANRYAVAAAALEDEAKRVTTLSTLELEVGPESFQYGKARLQCRSAMWALWERNAMLTLEEERPRLASVIGTGETSAGWPRFAAGTVLVWAAALWTLLLAR
ncbi:uncharacterized protein LOC117650580 [Thrips palmi]|uniref:Uncharacterized protein LOC117650580 n=1 Tax=Thrips palmi TaxID=161013 RepID=A0A6P8ZX69_THRPL|nr:uncharacterized protein LOC117650580 [Thrips palmi]